MKSTTLLILLITATLSQSFTDNSNSRDSTIINDPLSNPTQTQTRNSKVTTFPSDDISIDPSVSDSTIRTTRTRSRGMTDNGNMNTSINSTDDGSSTSTSISNSSDSVNPTSTDNKNNNTEKNTNNSSNSDDDSQSLSTSTSTLTTRTLDNTSNTSIVNVDSSSNLIKPNLIWGSILGMMIYLYN